MLLRCVPLALLVGFCSISATAGPISYSISFTGTGTLPTSGSFVYDSTTSRFTNFLVVWNGLSFSGLAGSANSPFLTTPPPACLGGLTGGAASFALLSGACTPPVAGGRTLWGANTQDRFYFFTTDVTNTITLAITGVAAHPNPPVNTEGGFSIAATATPEPSSIVLSISAGLLFTALARRRRT